MTYTPRESCFGKFFTPQLRLHELFTEIVDFRIGINRHEFENVAYTDAADRAKSELKATLHIKKLEHLIISTLKRCCKK